MYASTMSFGRHDEMFKEIGMIFRQLFEPLSSTYTYLLTCEETGQAILIDPVVSAMERDLAEIGTLA